jgi:hypothetical protein
MLPKNPYEHECENPEWCDQQERFRTWEECSKQWAKYWIEHHDGTGWELTGATFSISLQDLEALQKIEDATISDKRVAI